MGMLRSPFEKLDRLAKLSQEQPMRITTDLLSDETTVTVTVSASAPETEIRTRKNFNPLATFAPVVLTDAAGRATVQIKLPDNLTRYRVMAVAVAGEKQFGKGESAITGRLPLMARPSAPRFLNIGDGFTLPGGRPDQPDQPQEIA